MAINENALKRMHKELSRDYDNLGDYNSFAETMQNSEEARRSVHQALSEKYGKEDVGDYDYFMQQMGFEMPEAQQTGGVDAATGITAQHGVVAGGNVQQMNQQKRPQQQEQTQQVPQTTGNEPSNFVEQSSQNAPEFYDVAMGKEKPDYGMQQSGQQDQTLVPLSREESQRTAKERRDISSKIRTEQELQRAATTKNVVDAMKRTYDYQTQLAQQGNEVSMEKAREAREAEVNAQRVREAAANYTYDYVVRPAIDKALGDERFGKEILKVQDAKESARMLDNAITDEAAAIYARTAYGADFSRMSQDQRNGIKNELDGQLAGQMVEELSRLKAPTSAIEYYQRKVRGSMMMNQVQGFITNVLGTEYAQMSRAVEQSALTNYENSKNDKWYGGVLTGAAQGTAMFLDMMLMDKFLKSGATSWMNNVAAGSLSGYSAAWAPGSRGVAQAVVDKLVNNAWTNGIIRGSAAMASQYLTFGRIDAVNAGLGILNDPNLINRYGSLNTVGGWLNELGSDASNIVSAYAHGGETGAKLFTIGHLTAGIPGITGKALGFGAEIGFFTVNGVNEKIDEHNSMNPNDQIGLWDYDNWTQETLTNVGMIGAMKLMGTGNALAGADLRTRSQRMRDYATSTNELMKKIGMEFDRDDFYALERAGLGKMKSFDFDMMQKLMESGNYDRLVKSNELPLTTLFKLRMAMEHRMGVAGYTADDQGNVVATMNPYDLVKQAVWSSGEHGRFNVTAYGMNDEVVMQKSFGTPDEAKKYALALNYKGADNGRRMMEMMVGDNMHIVKDAIHEWADENGVGRLDAEEVYADWLAERENAMPLAKEVSEQIRNKIWAKMSENRQAIIAEIREDIRQKTGVDLNGVLQKPANMLTEEERDAFDRYTRALEERKKDDTTDPAVRIVEKTMDPKSGTVKFGTDSTGREVTVKEGEGKEVILTDPNTGEPIGMVDGKEVEITNEVPAEQVVEANKAAVAEAERQAGSEPVEEKPTENAPVAEEELPNGALAEEGTPIKYYDENNDLVDGTYIGPDHLQSWKHVIKDKNGNVVSRRLDEDEIVLPEAKAETTAEPINEAPAETENVNGTGTAPVAATAPANAVGAGMPLNAKGKPDPIGDGVTPERALQYFEQELMMEPEDAKNFVKGMEERAGKDMEKIIAKRPDPKKFDDPLELQQAIAEWTAQGKALREVENRWKAIAGEIKAREDAARAKEEAIRKQMAAEEQARIDKIREEQRKETEERERAHREFMAELERKRKEQEALEAEQANEELTGDQMAEQAVMDEQKRRERMRIGKRLAEVGQLTDLDQPDDEAMAAQVAYLSPDFKVTPESLRLELGSNFGKFGREGMLRLADNNGRTISEIADAIVQAAGYDENGQWKLDANKVREELIKCIQEGSASAIEALEKRVGIGTQRPEDRPEYWTPEKIAEYEARQQQQQPMTEVQQQIATASEEVNTSPTDAQKEAGNYKKGHVKLDGMEISIEQPKGSTRSGIDADGLPWAVKMNNTYGYIRGTKGKDKDHIDIFLSDNPEEGSVFVVDQIDPRTGEFDEHKVMYGFNSLEEAREAYLSNYMSDWQGLGNITEVNKTAFKVWLSESVHKTKPFADYRLVKAEQAKMGIERGYDERRDPFAADQTHEFLNGNEGLETIDEAPFSRGNEPYTENVSPEQKMASNTLMTALKDNAGIDVVMESQEEGQRKAAETMAVNDQFNIDLQKQIDGTLPEGHVYKMGMPSDILLSTGIPNLPIQMNAQRLIDKATKFGHDFKLEEVKDLVNAIQNPIAIFSYGNKEKAQNIIIEIEKDGNNFIVGLSLNPEIKGKHLEINSIRNVFPKKNSEWMNWITQNKMLYCDKQKIKALIDKQRTILADVEYLDLNDVAKVVDNFENPKFSGENLHRTGEKNQNKDYLKRPNGTVYGWVEGNKIHLTPEGINPNTPIHEYSHLWAESVKKNAPKLWENVKGLMKETDIWKEVLGDDLYQNIHGDEDRMASEVLSRLSGRRGAEKLTEMAKNWMAEHPDASIDEKAAHLSIIARMKQAIKDVWNWVGKELFGIEKFGSAEEVADRTLYDLMNGTDLKLEEISDSKTEFSARNKEYDENTVKLDENNYVDAMFDMSSKYTNRVHDELQSLKKDIRYNAEGSEVNNLRIPGHVGQSEYTQIGQNDIVGYKDKGRDGQGINPVYGRDIYKAQWEKLEKPMQEYKEFYERMAEKAPYPWMKADLQSKARGVEMRMERMKQLAEGVEPTNIQMGRWAASDNGSNSVRYRDYNGENEQLRKASEEHMKAVENGDMETAQKLVDEAAKAAGYTIHAYHGTNRADRVGTEFKPERATSGPMSFFTDNKGIADNYAKNKKDTSMAYDGDWDAGDYHTQFKVNVGGYAGEVRMENAWGYLPYELRNEITKKAMQVTTDDNGNIITEEGNTRGTGGYDWKLKQRRGNAIKALVDEWLDSGNLFNKEGQFMEVLEKAGVLEAFEKMGWKDARYLDPNYSDPKTYDTYLKIEKPFDTNEMYTEKFVDRLENWWNRLSKKKQAELTKESMDADHWDKNSKTIEQWVEDARYDLAHGETWAWTVIPDALTEYLKSKGYDGIIDRGGKGGGTGHNVFIPFYPEQIKSAEAVTRDAEGKVIPLSERFDTSKKDIRYRDYDSNDVFYSNAQKAIEGIKQEKATAEQWLKMIQNGGGLKAGEDKWLGLSDWLKDKQAKGEKVTKQEILDYINRNKIEIEEVNYSEDAKDNEDYWKEQVSGSDEFSALVDELVEYDENDNAYINREEFDRKAKENPIFRDAFSIDYWGEGIDIDDSLAAAQYLKMKGNEKPIDEIRMNYTTEGLTNKKEIALTVPGIKPYNESDDIHFGDAGEGRAVAWVRFGDATAVSKQYAEADKAVNDYLAEMRDKYGVKEGDETDVMTKEEITHLQSLTAKLFEGKDTDRVLVIDEIQSKRHQDGREKGYTPFSRQELEEVRDKAYRELYGYMDELRSKYEQSLYDSSFIGASEVERTKLKELRDKYDQAQNDLTEAVPDAPFEKNWSELALKRMLRYAAENGYDKVAWTTGEQQAKRYDMSKTLSYVTVTHEDYDYRNGKWDNEREPKHIHMGFTDERTSDFNVAKDGVIMDGDFKGHRLDEVFGKEMAKEILSIPVDEYETPLSGNNLKIGGEGMKGFYDTMLPSFMNKYGKKWGVKVGQVELEGVEDDARTMWSVDVTPEMKESVMHGQPMFRRGEDVKPTVKPEEVTEAANDMAGKLNKEVKVCQNADEISDESVKAAVKKAEAAGKTPTRKGWFNTKTGEIEVYAPAAESVEDVQKTVLHETVGHYGLRELLSNNEHDYNNAMVEMYRLMNNDQKKEVQKLMSDRKYDVATAMDEYLAKMAEDRNNSVDPGFWQKVKSVVKNLLRKIGIDVELSDGDLKYLLWSSHEALKNSREVVNADGSKSRVYDRKTIDQKAADWAMRWHNDVLGLRNKWEAEHGRAGSEVRNRDTDPDDDPTTPGGGGSPSPTGGREYTIEQKLNMEAMKFDKQLEEIQNETDKKAVGDRLLRFVKERMQPLTGKRMTSMDINGLISKIEHAKNLTRKSAMENALLDIDDTIVHAEVSAEVEDMLNKLNIKTQTSTKKGLVKGVLVDDTANRILTDIKASYQQMINTTADARMSEIRREIRKKMAEYGISRQDDPAMPEELKNAIAPLKQQMAELAEQKKEMQTNQQMETLDQLNEREQFIQSEIGNIAANGGEMSEAYTEELMALPIKKKLAEMRKLKSLIDGVPEGGGDNLNRALEKTSRNSELWTALMKEKVRAQRNVARLSREINEELSNIVGEGRDRRRAEVQEEIRREIELDRITCNALRMNEVTDQQKQKANETFWTSIKDDLQKMSDLNNAPTFSFNYLLKLVDMNHGLGDGELYAHFMKSERGALKANDNMKMGIREFGKNVDDMAEKIFGKGNRASALESLIADSDKRTGKPIYKLTEKSPDPNAVQQRDDRNMTKGEMLYMWLTWRQEAGKLKMMQAGWTERSISEMEEQMGEEYKQFGTWASDVFLPRLRADKYNQTYRKIYGTDMHAAKHYFPIRIDKTAIMDKSEVGMNEPEGMPVSGASNLIVRTGNTLPVDASVNAIEMLLDYGRKMERWNAMQDLVKDLNTIYRCKAVGNLMEANHKGMYEIFKNAANVATGNFDIDEKNVYDKIFGYLQRGGTGAAIRYGWYTALKQTLSAPAFLSYDDSWRYQAIRLMNQTPLTAYKNYQWAKENLPAFADRIADNDMGIEGLNEKTVLDILTGKVAKYGMMANKVVDACTVANGAYAIYKYDSERYKKMLNDDGTRKYTDEQAEDMAKVNAELAFNESQQSSRNEMSSPVQKSRSIVNKGATAFQNSNIGYRRMALEGYHDWERAGRIRDNRIAQAEKIADETARNKAIEEAKTYYWKMKRRGAMKMATVGILNAWWFMGLNPALTWRMVTMNGDDDDKDKFVKGMLMNVALGYLTNGTMLGPIISTGVTKIMNGEVRNIDLNPFMFLTVMNDAVNDVKNTLKNDDWGELSWALVKNSIRAGGGVDLEKFDNMCDGIYDIWERGGVKRDDIFKILNMPKSQRKEFAEHDVDLPISEYIKNYMSADKRVNPGERGKAWLGGIGYEKELTDTKMNDILKMYMNNKVNGFFERKKQLDNLNKEARKLYKEMTGKDKEEKNYKPLEWDKAMKEVTKDDPETQKAFLEYMNTAPDFKEKMTHSKKYDDLLKKLKDAVKDLRAGKEGSQKKVDESMEKLIDLEKKIVKLWPEKKAVE